MPLAAQVSACGQPVNPAAPSIEGTEDRRGQASGVLGYQDQVGIPGENSRKLRRHILRAEFQPGCCPEFDEPWRVGHSGGSDAHRNRVGGISPDAARPPRCERGLDHDHEDFRITAETLFT